jgi:aldehyde:ferredoxin oxidoreductase
LPSRNWQENTFDRAPAIGAEAFEKYIVRARACHGCPIGCSRDTKIVLGGEEIVTEGPEYETIYAFGSDCAIDDPRIIIAADQLCDDYGMDTISCGATIAFAMECFERGLVTRGDAGGLDLRFGNGEALLEAVHLIGRKEGIGELLSEGTRRASEKIEGAAGLAIHVKGLELPAYDPRGMKGQALTYALSDRGGCHLRSNALRTELLGIPEPVDRYAYQGKAEMIRELQLKAVTYNSLIACFFSTFAVGPEDYAEALSALTGWSVTLQELRTTAERTWNLTRLFNVREGLTRQDDTLPGRLFVQASTKGPSRGEVVERASFEKMLDAYYEIAGWDPHTGIPTQEKLEELEIAHMQKQEN